MKLSIVSATFNRGPLLERALETYARQDLDPAEWEYLLVDDGSTDNTREVCAQFKDRINLTVLDAATDLQKPKQPGQWRDGCALRNAASTFAAGEVMVSTHPEIMIPPQALRLAYETADKDRSCWATAIPYWLPPEDIDQVQWQDDLSLLRTVPGFYDPSWPDALQTPGAPDYRNQNQEIRTTWESEVWWAMDMHLWRWIGGFREFDQWGSVDLDFWARRRSAKIPTTIIQDAGHFLMVYHQWHDSKRDMDLAMEGVKGTDYSSFEKMQEQGGLWPVYHHGHRERAADGRLAGVMQDHINRYLWANAFAQDRHVLDVGCGTGYGSYLLANAHSYFGVDLDTESIRWAKTHYRKQANDFAAAQATALPVADLSQDLVTCFEVLEHVADQSKVLAEIRRVLRPGGWLCLSTPQKGATAGTPWDRYMLTNQELLALFDPAQWKLTQHHQLRYGNSHVLDGAPPADAEIQIIRAQRLA
jgi:2-polyprenyl-3-methyl-5-hydroxy-6-metoxy-1,4-benzoquinol methylase